MATVCGSSLAMMDAGIPLKRPVAGIAMGLIKEDDSFAVLSDILGDEDHLGDMDFKVAGTSEGVTSLQMDIKITGITEEIMRVALAQAREGRLHILGEMAKALGEARAELGEDAPRIETIRIPTEKIREVIGSGGSVIRSIVEESGAKIDIEDDGTVRVAAARREAIEAALKRIREIASEPEVGEIYKGKVVKIMDFGVFVNFFGSRDGLVHISQLTSKGRPSSPSEVVKEGQEVYVKLLGFDDRGKVRLSMKVVDQQTGKESRKSRALRVKRWRNARRTPRPAGPPPRPRGRLIVNRLRCEAGGTSPAPFIELVYLRISAGARRRRGHRLCGNGACISLLPRAAGSGR